MSDEKTTTGQAPEQEAAPVLPMKLDVSVRPIEPKGHLVGFASLKINDSFVIDDFKILQSDKGLFVGAEQYGRNLEEAAAAGVFGAPFYIVRETGQKFWGQDRLTFLADHLATI